MKFSQVLFSKFSAIVNSTGRDFQYDSFSREFHLVFGTALNSIHQQDDPFLLRRTLNWIENQKCNSIEILKRIRHSICKFHRNWILNFKLDFKCHIVDENKTKMDHWPKVDKRGERAQWITFSGARRLLSPVFGHVRYLFFFLIFLQKPKFIHFSEYLPKSTKFAQ